MCLRLPVKCQLDPKEERSGNTAVAVVGKWLTLNSVPRRKTMNRSITSYMFLRP